MARRVSLDSLAVRVAGQSKWFHANWRGIRLGLVCGLVACLLTRLFPFVAGIDEWIFDGILNFRGVRPSSANVILIELDNQEMDAFDGPLLTLSPKLAEVVAYVNSKGAAAVGIDLIVPESAKDYSEIQSGTPGDAGLLGQEILNSGNVVLAEWYMEDGWLRPLPQWRLKALISDEQSPTDLAFVNLTEDRDRFVRRQQMLFTDEEETQLHFALALAMVARDEKLVVSQGNVLQGDDRLPLDDQQQLLINFVGPPGTLPRVSLRAVLEAAREGTNVVQNGKFVDFKDAVVIIGDTSRAGQDYHPTPYANENFFWPWGRNGSLMSGLEIHGNLAAMLVTGQFLRKPPYVVSLSLVLVFGGVLGACLSNLNLVQGFCLAFFHHFAWKIVAYLVLIGIDYRLEMVDMLLMGMLAYMVTFALRWRRLRRMLGVVKSEAIARELESNPRAIDSRGKEAIVTLLFSDIRGYTTFAEKIRDGQKIVTLLNEYFQIVVPILEKHHGTLNCYMGDGVMVMFGAPTPLENSVLCAVEAAREMVEAVHREKKKWTAAGFDGMRIGVGVHTGPVIVGAVGSPSRLDYTAIGDVVNTTARIEAENKTQRTEILISSAAFVELSPQDRQRLGCETVPIKVKVKGKDELMELYEIKVEELAAVGDATTD